MFKDDLKKVDLGSDRPKRLIFDELNELSKLNNYTVIEMDDERPWGGYIRYSNKDAKQFLADLFPDIGDRRVFNEDLGLSPKLLLVAPGQRLSWQYHNRRSELWLFLNDGYFVVSKTNKEPEPQFVKEGELAKIRVRERHRVIGRKDGYTLIAEIWQHTNSKDVSDEDDIIRIEDDYNR